MVERGTSDTTGTSLTRISHPGGMQAAYATEYHFPSTITTVSHSPQQAPSRTDHTTSGPVPTPPSQTPHHPNTAATRYDTGSSYGPGTSCSSSQRPATHQSLSSNTPLHDYTMTTTPAPTLEELPPIKGTILELHSIKEGWDGMLVEFPRVPSHHHSTTMHHQHYQIRMILLVCMQRIMVIKIICHHKHLYCNHPKNSFPKFVG